MAQGVQSTKVAQCLKLSGTSPRDHRSTDSNLTSGTINGGRSDVQHILPYGTPGEVEAEVGHV